MAHGQDFKQSDDLAKDLGLTETLTIGIGVMIGAGIFILPRFAIDAAGPGAIFAYILAGISAMITASSTSELASGMPKSGGLYFYVSRAMGSFLGTISGFSLWLSLTFAVAFYLKGFGEYLALFLPLNDNLLAIIAGFLFIGINYIGAKETGRMQNIITGALISILTVFVVWGFFNVDFANWSPFLPHGTGQILPTTALVFVSFIGFGEIAAVGEEVKDPGYTMPRALMGSVLIPTIFYVVVILVTSGIIPYQGIINIEAPLVEAAQTFAGALGVIAITFAALLATASSANASVLASTRISFAMGRDRTLPEWINEIHEKFLTPYRAILIAGVLTPILILTTNVEFLSKSAGVLTLINYGLINLAVLIMRANPPEGYEPEYKAPGAPWLPILGAISSFGIIFLSGTATILSAVGLIMLGLIWYFVWGKKRSKVKAVVDDIGWQAALTGKLAVEEKVIPEVAEKPVAEELIVEEGYQVLTPVANPKTENALLRITAEMLKSAATFAEATALNIIEIPSQVPLDVAKQKEDFLAKHRDVQKDILQVAADFGERENVLINPRIIYSRDRFKAIHNLIKKEQIDFLLLGWHGTFNKSKIRSSLVKKLIRLAPCPVGVLKDNGLEKIKNILIPYRGSEHAHWGVEVAQRLAFNYPEESKVTVLRVLNPGADAEQEKEEAWAEIEDVLTGEIEVEVRVVFANDVTGGILTEEFNYDYDLIIMGASKEWRFKNMLFGSKPDIIAEKANTSVLMVRRYDQQVEEIEKEIAKEEKMDI
ncbi:amino acid permease [Fuchsiella alkaliacetigena]|uniref:amino acid permease n=1 Tax=Fuchsiella alkaliacetigena TaxID=957042 RepID=UPI00200A9826|nr:amino acid permease [Fuchsiella alkaliacetigena]MCK8825043.1 amino acid permease [Fuchsiella alkaliacetigena]